LRGRSCAVFCSTGACHHAFVGGMERGMALLDLGIILAPGSWVPRIVERELTTGCKHSGSAWTGACAH
jgi:hypothetical protein